MGRGATLDTVDVPLNNRQWLQNRFNRIREIKSEDLTAARDRRDRQLDQSGPGRFLRRPGRPPPPAPPGHGLRHTRKTQPFFARPMTGFDQEPAWRRSWCRHGGALCDQPLRIRYTGLDPAALYKLRVVYTGDMFQAKLRLLAGETIEIHPFLLKPRDMTPLEFDLPAQATRTGVLDLSWYAEPGRGGNGRGCQVSEVWLVRNDK